MALSLKGEALGHELPEFHLHIVRPRRLAKIFVDTVNDSDRTRAIPAHSSESVDKIPSRIGLGAAPSNEVNLYKKAIESKRKVAAPTDVEGYPDGFSFYKNRERVISA